MTKHFLALILQLIRLTLLISSCELLFIFRCFHVRGPLFSLEDLKLFWNILGVDSLIWKCKTYF